MWGRKRLVAHSSILAITLSWAVASYAEGQAADSEMNEVVVTGTSIKGVAPVGSSLSTLSADQIHETAAQSMQQVLKMAPAVTGLQAPSQGGFGSADNSGTDAPTIHGLGASASNSTLILMNGHRLPTSGANHVLTDPNIIPPIALERVEVLADGASSVYGSDAVAGVINFITRKYFEGWEVDGQAGFGDSYRTYNAQTLYGHGWDNGNFLAAFSYSFRSNLPAQSRSYSKSVDFAPLGGNNANASNRCTSPSLTSGATYFNTGTAGAYSTEPVGYGAQAGGSCNPTNWDLIPQEVRNTAYVEINQELSDKWHFSADFDYSNRKDTQQVSRGTASATIYGPGSTVPTGRSTNPFFQQFTLLNAATGATSSPTSYTLNFDGNKLFGPGALSIGEAEDLYGHVDLTYDITSKWNVNFGGLLGRDRSQIITSGALNSATFNLATNGFTSAPINGVTNSVSQALTTANAFDPFNGGTSAGTLGSLIDSSTYYTTTQTLENAYAKVSGELFNLPGGPVKLAVGGETIDYSIDQGHTALNGLGPASADSVYIPLSYGRDVYSGYAEAYLPLVKDMLVKSVDLDVSVRYDHYSDFGSTTNPKVGANVEPINGVKLRGSYSKSFVAPALTSIGANSSGQTGESAFTYEAGSAVPGGLASVPIAAYPGVQNIPGAICSATSCNLTSITGAQISGGKSGLKPQTGNDTSAGFDLTPDPVPGLRLSFTYWKDELRNGITAPSSVYALNTSSLNNLLQVFPGAATPAQIAAAQGVLPTSGASAPVYWTYNYTQNNVLNLNVAGIDLEALYRLSTNVGNFMFDASFTHKTQFDQFFGTGGTIFSVLGTAGFNTTFPSLTDSGRAMLSYDKGPFNAVLSINYEGPYTWWGGGVVNPIVKNGAGLPTGGGDKVNAFTTIDLHAGYTLENWSLLRSANVYVDITNLLDQAPPFVNTAATNGAVGYDSFSANPLGRVISIGLRSKF
jgi:iron complex outermembrane receptor protein